MARIDDYVNAKKIAVESLQKKSIEHIAGHAGFEVKSGNRITQNFLDRNYSISYPDFEFKDRYEDERDVPIQEQVIILHYLLGAEAVPAISGKWISYREIPDASFYFSAFVKRAVDPLKKVFGMNISGLKKAALQIHGSTIEAGDAGFEFQIFPKVPMQMILWHGDEEFTPEANILFDNKTGDILSPEDVAWMAGMTVYRLIALSFK